MASDFCPDVSDSAWRGRLAPRSVEPKRQPEDHNAEASPTPKSPECPRTPPAKSLLSAPVKNGESPSLEGLASLILDAPRPVERGRLRKVQTVPRLLPEGPENGTLCLSQTTVKNKLPTSKFFPPEPRKAFPEGKNGLSSFKAQPKSRLWREPEPELQQEGAQNVGLSGDGATGVPSQGAAEGSPQPRSEDPGDASQDPGSFRAEERIPEVAGEPGSAATEQVSDRVFCMALWPERSLPGARAGSPQARTGSSRAGSEAQRTVGTMFWDFGVSLASPWALRGPCMG